jgi:hypothetical protein
MKCYCFNCLNETDMLLVTMVTQCYYIKYHGYCNECGKPFTRLIYKPKHI